MKKNYTASLLLVFLLSVLMFACKRKAGEHTAETVAAADTAILNISKPVNEQVLARMPVIQAKKGSRLYVQEVQGRIEYDARNQLALASKVSGRIEKLYVKFNYQPVKKGQLIMEIYSPDLAAAQREMLLIQQHGNTDGMLKPARRRLLLLGMDISQINRVLRTGQVAYRIPVYSNANGFILEQSAASAAVNTSQTAAGTNADAMAGMAAGVAVSNVGTTSPVIQNTPVMIREGQYLSAGQQVFTIYRSGDLLASFSLTPEIASQINREEKVLIQRLADPANAISGKIGMIQPVLNAGENFVIARVYLKHSGLTPGELVTGQFPFFLKSSYWLPRAAVVSLGNESVVFKKEGGVFIPSSVRTGVVQNGEVQVFDDISTWQLAANAQYLVDSESFIKTAKE
jgi:Cu(I)/Ag(I) efflux system membrane fusion protein